VVESAMSIESFQDDIRISCPGWVTDPKSTPIRYEISARKEGVSEWLILQSLEPSSVFQSFAAFSPGNYIARVKIQDSMGSTSFTEQVMLFTVTGNSLEKRGLEKRDDDTGAEAYDMAEYIRASSTVYSGSKGLTFINIFSFKGCTS
jgi:hypothetical protein